MLNYDGIDVSEGIDVNKTNVSYKCIICTFYYFLKTNWRLPETKTM